MQFLEPTETERQILEGLRPKLIAAKEPEAILNQLPLMLAEVGRANPSMLALASALTPAERAIGYVQEGIRIFLGRRADPARPFMAHAFPQANEFEETLGIPVSEVNDDQRSAYQLDLARRFLVAHTMASMRATNEVYTMLGVKPADVFQHEDSNSNGMYYGMTTVNVLLVPEVARLQKLTGEEAYALLEQPLRPAFLGKGVVAADKPTRQ